MRKIAIIVLMILMCFVATGETSWFYMKAGSTSQIIQIPIYDSSSTTGALLTGLVYNSSGLTAYYNRAGAAGAATQISLVTATKGTWTSSGFVAVDGTNMPGWYELHIPDAALAAGANSVSIHLKGATNMVPTPIIIQLVANDGTNANVTQWNGTNVATPDTAGYPKVTIKSGTGTGELNLSTGRTDANTTYIAGAAVSTTTAQLGVNAVNVGGTAQTGRDLGASVLLSSGTGTGQVNLSSGRVGINWGDVANPTSTVGLTNTTISTTQGVASVSGAVGSVTGNVGGSCASVTGAVGSVTGNVGGSCASVTGAVGSVTGNVGGNVTGSCGSVTGAVGSVTGNVGGNVTGSVGSVSDPSGIWNKDISGYSGAGYAGTYLKNVKDKLPTNYLMGSSVVTDKDDEIDAIKAKTDNMPAGVKKNTQLANFEFLMVDSADHITAKTGLTVTCTRSIDGAAFASCSNSVAEVGSGIYKVTLSADDLNGDVITLKFTASGADQRTITIKTNP